MWKRSEDELLLSKCKNLKKVDWGRLSKLFPGRTKNSLKIHFKQLIGTYQGPIQNLSLIPPSPGSPRQALVESDDYHAILQKRTRVPENVSPSSLHLVGSSSSTTSNISSTTNPKGMISTTSTSITNQMKARLLSDITASSSSMHPTTSSSTTMMVIPSSPPVVKNINPHDQPNFDESSVSQRTHSKSSPIPTDINSPNVPLPTSASLMYSSPIQLSLSNQQHLQLHHLQQQQQQQQLVDSHLLQSSRLHEPTHIQRMPLHMLNPSMSGFRYPLDTLGLFPGNPNNYLLSASTSLASERSLHQQFIRPSLQLPSTYLGSLSAPSQQIQLQHHQQQQQNQIPLNVSLQPNQQQIQYQLQIQQHQAINDILRASKNPSNR